MSYRPRQSHLPSWVLRAALLVVITLLPATARAFELWVRNIGKQDVFIARVMQTTYESWVSEGWLSVSPGKVELVSVADYELVYYLGFAWRNRRDMVCAALPVFDPTELAFPVSEPLMIPVRLGEFKHVHYGASARGLARQRAGFTQMPFGLRVVPARDEGRIILTVNPRPDDVLFPITEKDRKLLQGAAPAAVPAAAAAAPAAPAAAPAAPVAAPAAPAESGSAIQLRGRPGEVREKVALSADQAPARTAGPRFDSRTPEGVVEFRHARVKLVYWLGTYQGDDKPTLAELEQWLPTVTSKLHVAGPQDFYSALEPGDLLTLQIASLSSVLKSGYGMPFLLNRAAGERYPRVSALPAGASTSKGGVEVNDRVISVDGVDIGTLTPLESAKLTRGEKGTAANLQIQRGSGAAARKLQVREMREPTSYLEDVAKPRGITIYRSKAGGLFFTTGQSWKPMPRGQRIELFFNVGADKVLQVMAARPEDDGRITYRFQVAE